MQITRRTKGRSRETTQITKSKTCRSRDGMEGSDEYLILGRVVDNALLTSHGIDDKDIANMMMLTVYVCFIARCYG
eukprot:461101-Amphidinium_carterae.1